MKPFFHNEQRILKLIYEAGTWVGTPWVANSHAKGHGVSCHNLPMEIYKACGFLGETFPRIVGDPTRSRHSAESEMVPFLDGRREFQRINLDEEKPIAGDLLGIRIYSCVDHLAVCLGIEFVQVLMHKKTCLDLIAVPPWSQRIEAVWRPIELL